MSALVSFDYGEKPIRVVMVNGEPWWVAKDVCAVLGYTWAGSASIRHVPDEWKGINSVMTPSSVQEMSILSEQGLYFFLGRSDKPSALPFQKLLAGDVLPAIRKHGMYATDELLDNPDLLVEVATRLRDERKARLIAEAKVVELTPKAAFFDHVADSTDKYDMNTAGKMLGIGEVTLFAWLRSIGVLMGNNKPYQEHVTAQRFDVVQTAYSVNDEKRTNSKTVVTGKGLIYLRERIEEAGGVRAIKTAATKRRRRTGRHKRR